MTIDVLVPPLSQTMDTLILVKWEKQVGDPVQKGETLFVVETDKATLDVESPGAGVLHEILAEPGSEVPVRSKIGTLLAEGESAPAPSRPPAGEKARSTVASAAPSKIQESIPSPNLGRVFSSPRARRLARQEAAPIERIAPSGPRQMIVERDVRAYLDQKRMKPRVTPLAKRVAEDRGVDLAALQQNHGSAWVTRTDVDAYKQAQADEASAGGPAAAVAEPPMAAEPVATPAPLLPATRRMALTNIRKTIARRMQESHQATAPVTLTREVDATELRLLREKILLEVAPGAPRPSYTDFLILVTARCLAKHPMLNGTFSGDSLDIHEDVHMALAVDTDRGLVVPVILSAQKMGLVELARARSDLARRAVEDQLNPSELAGGTFTITNLGPQGIDAFTPIINPPQIAILGIGRILPAAMVFEGQLAVRDRMLLSLTFDHRVVDGAPAARFLHDIAQLVEKPYRIWL